MKFNLIILLILVYSCTNNYTRLENRAPYNSKGLALIYNERDLDDKVIKGKLDNSMLQISHQNLNVNTMINLLIQEQTTMWWLEILNALNTLIFIKLSLKKLLMN